ISNAPSDNPASKPYPLVPSVDANANPTLLDDRPTGTPRPEKTAVAAAQCEACVKLSSRAEPIAPIFRTFGSMVI
ncbi:hypothetical protein NE450_14125, partial [[Eubacterium] rectale]|nr:hypothetical protein [Agathobacter rectalis]